MLALHSWQRLLLTAVWLGLCAWQDGKTRHVSNLLTLPAFLLAWPVALWDGTIVLVFAVFAGTYTAHAMRQMGAADGKIATALTAFAPLGLAAGAGMSALAFLWLRIRGEGGKPIPGAVWMFAGTALALAWTLMRRVW